MQTIILLSEGGMDTSLAWVVYLGVGFFFTPGTNNSRVESR